MYPAELWNGSTTNVTTLVMSFFTSRYGDSLLPKKYSRYSSSLSRHQLSSDSPAGTAEGALIGIGEREVAHRGILGRDGRRPTSLPSREGHGPVGDAVVVPVSGEDEGATRVIAGGADGKFHRVRFGDPEGYPGLSALLKKGFSFWAN